MDKATLVKRLNEVFNLERENGLIIDQFGLAPAYRGWSSYSFTLGVSAPSLVGLTSSTKTGIIIDALFKSFNLEERRAIDRVRVFNNVTELNLSAPHDFEYFDARQMATDFTPEIYDVV